MIDPDRLAALAARESRRHAERHPRCGALSSAAAPHFLYGVPMHWMRDWHTPTPLVVASAQGQRLVCADGHVHLDFCLGDTGAMYGHSPQPVARAIARQAARGLTAMLPGEMLAEVGERLSATFGLPVWQLALSASDANRFLLRWARAATGRPKVLVFEGCYHGTVDDTLVDRAEIDGRTLIRASLLGQVHDLSLGTVVVPFNDLDAVAGALARGDVACVLTEPALTNCGLVPPVPGFLPGVQALCRRHGALLLLDETHTLSTGWGGYARVHGLEPDALVIGKAIAGGLPCAVYGVTTSLAQRMEAAKNAAPEGHSGIGTTLSANLLALAALQASLAELIVPAAHAAMEAAAARLEAGLAALISARGLAWSVTRLGARMELQFRSTPPRDAREARAAMDEALERALQLFLLGRGIVVTPFHNMLLVPPGAGEDETGQVIDAVAAFLDELQPGG